MDARGNHAAAAPVSRSRPTHRPARRRRVFGETAVPLPIAHEQIVRLAYEIYVARGDGEGDALSDWLAAECELRACPSSGVAMPDLPELDRYH